MWTRASPQVSRRHTTTLRKQPDWVPAALHPDAQFGTTAARKNHRRRVPGPGVAGRRFTNQVHELLPVPRAKTTDVPIYYEASGSGPTVAFINEAGLGAWLWAWQHPALAGRYEALVWDPRGVGRTPKGEPDRYTVDMFAGDFESVLADHGTARAHLVGTGFGGMVALEYASEYGRAASITLLGTTRSGECVDPTFGGLFTGVMDKGGKEVDGGAGGRNNDDGGSACPDASRQLTPNELRGGFSQEFMSSHPALIDRILRWRREEDAGPTVARRQISAMQTFERDTPVDVTIPARVFHGVDDPIVPIEAGRGLGQDLPRGQFVAVSGRHLCFIEHAGAVNDELIGFLDDCEADR